LTRHFPFHSDETFLVVDYCPRNLVQMSELENTEGLLPGGKAISDVHNYLAWITLLQNNEHKTVEWLVAFNSECERRRWVEAVTPQTSDNPEEKIYEEWDCPLVEAVVPFKVETSTKLSYSSIFFYIYKQCLQNNLFSYKN
jgi:neuronal guanine nucleotide exchange factor